jgi:glutamate receptor, ionotropic, invertebrate
LIMISSYTANLAAFLTIDRMDSPISSIQDLAKSEIRYGAVVTGSTTAFFKDSTSQMYRKMWARMKDWDGVLVDSNSDGVQKVLEGDGSFAFFMESLSIEYQTERNCHLIQVGSNLDAKSYGIALPKRSNLRPLLSSAIIRLKEKGIIAALKQKWWQEERGGGACHIKEKVGNVNRLTIHNLGGIFVVLAMGLSLGLIIMGLEILWVRWKTNRKSI